MRAASAAATSTLLRLVCDTAALRKITEANDGIEAWASKTGKFLVVFVAFGSDSPWDGRKTIYHPQKAIYTSRPDVYPAHRDVYTLQPDVYHPRPDVYEAQADVYTPRADVYDLQPDVYTLHPDVYEGQLDVYTPRSDVYDPRADVYTPQTDVYRPVYQAYFTRVSSHWAKTVAKKQQLAAQRVGWAANPLPNAARLDENQAVGVEKRFAGFPVGRGKQVAATSAANELIAYQRTKTKLPEAKDIPSSGAN